MVPSLHSSTSIDSSMPPLAHLTLLVLFSLFIVFDVFYAYKFSYPDKDIAPYCIPYTLHAAATSRDGSFFNHDSGSWK